MKKYLLILVAIIGLGISVNAQTAKCGSVVASVDRVDSGGNAYISLSNTGESVSVTITVAYTDGNGVGHTKDKVVYVEKGSTETTVYLEKYKDILRINLVCN